MDTNEQFQPLKSSKVREGAQGNGILKIVRDYKKGGKLITVSNGVREEAELQTGVLVTGTYEGTQESTIPDSGDIKVEHKIRADDGTLFLIGNTTSLSDDETGLSAVGEGSRVQLSFLGMKKLKSGRKFANFQVSVAG